MAEIHSDSAGDTATLASEAILALLLCLHKNILIPAVTAVFPNPGADLQDPFIQKIKAL